MKHFQIRKTSFGSFSAVSTNFAILQILRNAGRRPASNSIERRKPQRLATKTSKTATFENFEITGREPKPLPLTPYPYSLKQEGMKNEEWRMITQRSTYQAENWTSNTKKPHLVVLQSYFRYEPISPSYDPNEFVHFYNKKSHQKIMTFITIFLSLFFRILVFFFEKLRNTSTLSTNPKKKLKNSLIQPRTSRSNFGKISLNFEKIGPGGGPEALRYGWILRKHLKKPQLWTHEKIFVNDSEQFF